MLIGETANTSNNVFGWTRLAVEPMTLHTQGKHVNHDTEVVNSSMDINQTCRDSSAEAREVVEHLLLSLFLEGRRALLEYPWNKSQSGLQLNQFIYYIVSFLQNEVVVYLYPVLL